MTIAGTLSQAIALHQQGDLQKANALYASILNENPNHLQTLCLSGSIAQQYGNFGEAARLFNLAHQISPNQAAICLQLGICYSNLGDLETANTLYKQACSLAPNQLEPIVNLANNLTKLNQFQEAYALYRNTADFSKIFSKDLSYGFVRSFGATAGFDWNTKNDSYGSKKQMAVVGPTVMFNVPGFANLSVLELYESQYSNFNTTGSRYSYNPHAALDLAFGIPFSIGPAKFSFEGYWDYIGSKGQLEPGGALSGRETHFDGRIMYDVSTILTAKPKTFQLGFEYEFWKNKFGDTVYSDGPGTRASTPMVRGEYHF